MERGNNTGPSTGQGQVENARRGSLARQRSLSSDEVPLRNQPVSDGSIEERHEGPKKVAAYVGSGVAELPVSFRDYRTMPQEAVLYPVTSNMSKSDDGEQSGVSHLSADSPDQQSTGTYPLSNAGRKRKHPVKPGKHICQFCSRACTKPSVLEKHIRMHTNERPYPCEVCSLKFKTKSNLYKHRKSFAHSLKLKEKGLSGGSYEGSFGSSRDESLDMDTFGSDRDSMASISMEGDTGKQRSWVSTNSDNERTTPNTAESHESSDPWNTHRGTQPKRSVDAQWMHGIQVLRQLEAISDAVEKEAAKACLNTSRNAQIGIDQRVLVTITLRRIKPGLSKPHSDVNQKPVSSGSFTAGAASTAGQVSARIDQLLMSNQKIMNTAIAEPPRRRLSRQSSVTSPSSTMFASVITSRPDTVTSSPSTELDTVFESRLPISHMERQLRHVVESAIRRASRTTFITLLNLEVKEDMISITLNLPGPISGLYNRDTSPEPVEADGVARDHLLRRHVCSNCSAAFTKRDILNLHSEVYCQSGTNVMTQHTDALKSPRPPSPSFKNKLPGKLIKARSEEKPTSKGSSVQCESTQKTHRSQSEICGGSLDTGSCESSAKEQLKNHLLIKHRSQGSMAETEEPEQRSSPLQSSHQHRESAKAASLDRTSPRHHTTEHHRKTSSTHHTENSISSRSNHEVLSVSSTNASTSASASERKTQKPAPKLTSVSSIEMPTMLQIPAQVPPACTILLNPLIMAKPDSAGNIVSLTVAVSQQSTIQPVGLVPTQTAAIVSTPLPPRPVPPQLMISTHPRPGIPLVLPINRQKLQSLRETVTLQTSPPRLTLTSRAASSPLPNTPIIPTFAPVMRSAPTHLTYGQANQQLNIPAQPISSKVTSLQKQSPLAMGLTVTVSSLITSLSKQASLPKHTSSLSSAGIKSPTQEVKNVQKGLPLPRPSVSAKRFHQSEQPMETESTNQTDQSVTTWPCSISDFNLPTFHLFQSLMTLGKAAEQPAKLRSIDRQTECQVAFCCLKTRPLPQKDAQSVYTDEPKSTRPKDGVEPSLILNSYKVNRGDAVAVTAQSKIDNRSILTHSSYWKYKHKMRVMQSMPSVVTLEMGKPSNQKSPLPSSLESKHSPVAVTVTPPKVEATDLPKKEIMQSESHQSLVTHQSVIVSDHINKKMLRSLSTPTGAAVSDGMLSHKIKAPLSGGFKSEDDYEYVRGRGRGKYVCTQCGIRCKKPSMLKKHIRTHTDLRPYSCGHCKFSFKTKGNLTKHMRSKAHHRRCLELGINPVPTTVDDSQIDEKVLESQQQLAKSSKIKQGDESDDEEDEEEEEDDGSDEQTSDDDALCIDEDRSSPELRSDVPALPLLGSRAVFRRVQSMPAREVERSFSESSSEPISKKPRLSDHGDRLTKSRPMLGNIEDDIAQSLLDLSQTPIPNKPSTALPVKPSTALPVKPSTALPVKSYNLGQQGLDPVNASHPQSKGDFTQKQSDAHPHCTPMLGLNQQAMKFYQSQQRLPSPRHGSQEERKDPSPCQTLPIPTPALFMLDVRSRLSPLAGGSLSPHRQAACSAGQQRQSPHRQRQQLSPRPPVSPRHHPLGLQPLLMPAVTLQLPGSSHSPQRSPRHSPLPMSMISPRLPQMRSSQHNSPHASHDDNVARVSVVKAMSLPVESDQPMDLTVPHRSHSVQEQGHHQTSENKHICTLCGAIQPTPEKLAKHMELHVEIDSSCVGIAPRITKRPPPLKMSTDMVTGQRWRSGGQLKDPLTPNTPLRRQSAINTSPDGDDEMNHTMSRGDSAESSYDNLSSRKCHVCQKVFRHSSHLALHMKQHHSLETPEPDSGSNRGIASARSPCKERASYSRDWTDRERPQSPLCAVCDKKFKSVSSLKQHMVTHTELRPFICEYCDGGYPSAQALKHHLNTHTQERPYICGECGSTFGRSDHLKQHQKTHKKASRGTTPDPTTSLNLHQQR